MKTEAGIGSSHRLPLSTSDGAKQRGKSTEENPRGRRHDSIQNPGPEKAAGTARPLDSPRSRGGGAMFLIKLKRKVPRERKAKGGKKTEETTRGGALAGYRNAWTAKGAGTARPPSR